jgi:hypothetical protein
MIVSFVMLGLSAAFATAVCTFVAAAVRGASMPTHH